MCSLYILRLDPQYVLRKPRLGALLEGYERNLNQAYMSKVFVETLNHLHLKARTTPTHPIDSTPPPSNSRATFSSLSHLVCFHAPSKLLS